MLYVVLLTNLMSLIAVGGVLDFSVRLHKPHIAKKFNKLIIPTFSINLVMIATFQIKTDPSWSLITSVIYAVAMIYFLANRRNDIKTKYSEKSLKQLSWVQTIIIINTVALGFSHSLQL